MKKHNYETAEAQNATDCDTHKANEKSQQGA